MKKKYPLHKELASLAKMKPPVCKTLLPMMNMAISVMFPCRSDEKVLVNRYEIAGYEGSKIPVYVLEPREKQEELRSCLVFFHGGDFIFKASGAHYRIAKEYALRLSCKVVYVDYRLAPKYSFPVPVEDCYATYQWVLEQAKNLAIDPNCIFMGGDSAGGNLAIAVTLMAKQRGLPVPRAELLIYPVTDRRMETESMKKYTDTPMWNARLNAKMWELYLGTQTLGNMAYASPAEAQSLEGFPASYIEVAEYDCLKDEGIAFGNRLKEEKVPVELHEVKQACHGFETAINSSVTKEAINKRVDFLKRVR